MRISRVKNKNGQTKQRMRKKYYFEVVASRNFEESKNMYASAVLFKYTELILFKYNRNYLEIFVKF